MKTQETKESSESIKSKINFRFWEHFITPKLVKLMADSGNVVLAGELSPSLFNEQIIQDPDKVEGRTFWENAADPGGLSTKKALVQHVLLLKELLKNGIKFWVTDSRPWFVTERNQDLPGIFYYLMYLSGVAVSLGIMPVATYIALKERKIEGISRREFISGALSLGASLLISRSLYDVLLGRLRFLNSSISVFQEMIKKPEYLPVTEAIVMVRNDTMALNTLHMLELYRETTSPDELMFFAGVSHKDAETKFEQDQQSLITNVERYVDLLLDDTLEMLLQDSNLTDDQVLEILKGYSELFTQPEQYSKEHQTFMISSEKAGTIPCANAILVRRCVSRLSDSSTLPRKKNILNLFLFDLIRRNYDWSKMIRNNIVSSLNQLEPGIIHIDHSSRMDNLGTGTTTISSQDFSVSHIFDNERDFRKLKLFGVGVLYGRTVPLFHYVDTTNKYVAVDHNRLVPIEA